MLQSLPFETTDDHSLRIREVFYCMHGAGFNSSRLNEDFLNVNTSIVRMTPVIEAVKIMQHWLVYHKRDLWSAFFHCCKVWTSSSPDVQGVFEKSKCELSNTVDAALSTEEKVSTWMEMPLTWDCRRLFTGIRNGISQKNSDLFFLAANPWVGRR